MTTEIRHRLIPTLGARRSWYVHGADEARRQAEASFAETGIPVLVCEAPERGITRNLYTVGGANKKRRR